MSNNQNINETSDSKRLAVALKENLFNDIDKIYEYEEIKEFAKRKLGNDYTDGKVSGTINKMINKSILKRVSRGQYMLAESNNINIKIVVKDILENTINEIQDSLAKVSAVQISDEEFEALANTREVLRGLQRKIVIFE